MVKTVLAVSMLLAGGAAMAWPADSVVDPYGAGAIAGARFDRAQPKLVAAYQKGDRRPEVLLNLAAIRTQQSDRSAARGLYREVLEQPNMDMATLNGTAWSHEIARRGLAMDARVAAR